MADINVDAALLTISGGDVTLTAGADIQLSGIVNSNQLGLHSLYDVITLYSGIVNSSQLGSIALFGRATASMNLFLFERTGGEASGNLTLYTKGTSTSNLFSTMTLFLQVNSQSGVDVTATMPLFLNCSDPANSSGYMNLYLQGPAFSDTEGHYTGGIPLFLQNEVVTSGMPLFIIGGNAFGEVGTAGASILSGTMNLYLHRSTSNIMSLYMAGPGTPSTSGIDLYMYGGLNSSSGIDLAMPNVVGNANGVQKLFIRGF